MAWLEVLLGVCTELLVAWNSQREGAQGILESNPGVLLLGREAPSVDSRTSSFLPGGEAVTPGQGAHPNGITSLGECS